MAFRQTIGAPAKEPADDLPPRQPHYHYNTHYGVQ